VRISLARPAVVVCGLVLVALAYWRLYYGIDFTDESFYVAVPYRFVLGAKPYVDELSVTQTNTGILLYPFVWAYHRVAGRTGIVLFVRHLHFLLALGVGGATFVSLRRLLGFTAATVVAAIAFLFVPFDIPSVSYDSLGSGLFTAGCLLGFLSRRDPRVRVPAGLCLGLAAFAYPPLIVAVVCACALRLVVVRGRRLADLLGFVAPALLVPIGGMGALAAAFGLHRIVDDYRLSAANLGEAGGIPKLRQIATHEWTTFPYWYAVLAALCVVALTWRRVPRVAAAVVALLPLAFVPRDVHSYSASLDYVAHFGWLAVPLLFGLRRDRELSALFALVWVPALVGGVTTAYSSANGGVNFGVGFFPAAIVAVALAVRAAGQLGGPTIAPAVVTCALLGVFGLVPVYRDSSLRQLDARVHGGPYAGLVTSRRKRAFLERLDRDLASVTSGCRISFFADFPAGYLLTDASVDTNGVWTATVSPARTRAYQESLIGYYARYGLPNVAVLLRRIPYALPGSARIEHYRRNEPLLLLLRRDRFRRSAERFDYTIYRRGSCAAGNSRETRYVQ
jgi:hypothetical protein